MVGLEERSLGVLDELPTPINNRVIVRIDYDPTEQRSEMGIIMGSSWWEETEHVIRFGEIVSVCGELFEREVYGFGVEWTTDIEVEIGDTVYFTKMEAYNCPFFTKDEKVYCIMDYSELILRIRGDEYYPLNGYVICKKVEEQAQSSIINTDVTKKQNKNKGIIKWAGKPIESYFPKKSNIIESDDINEGDSVLFSLAGFTSLEDKRYAKLDIDLGYIQRRWIVAKLIG